MKREISYEYKEREPIKEERERTMWLEQLANESRIRNQRESLGVCKIHGGSFDDNGGKDICKTCEDWAVRNQRKEQDEESNTVSDVN